MKLLKSEKLALRSLAHSQGQVMKCGLRYWLQLQTNRATDWIKSHYIEGERYHV